MSSPHELSEYEANFYYAGISPGGGGPKLVYRTSTDVFQEPEGPKAYKRLMRLCCVDDDHALGKDRLWDRVAGQVFTLLDNRDIMFSSVDLVRFTWPNKIDGQGDQKVDVGKEEDQGDRKLSSDDLLPIKPVEDGSRYITPPTIWIGVVFACLTAKAAYDCSLQILDLLKQYDVSDVDVAFRESVVEPLSSLALRDTDTDLDSCKVSSTSLLSLPVAGIGRKAQGTLGFYFRVGSDLYAATTRHSLFNNYEFYREYNYDAMWKKRVVVMAPRAFDNYVGFIQADIATHNDTVVYLTTRATAYMRGREEAGEDSIRAEKWARDLEDTEHELARTREKVSHLEALYVDIMTCWRNPQDRVVGYVDWAPAIGVSAPPHPFTRDLCIIKLDRAKFKNFLGSVLNLGPKLSREKFQPLMHDSLSDCLMFPHPQHGVAGGHGILTANGVNKPNDENADGKPVRCGIKHGSASNATAGTLSKYMSRVRKYDCSGHTDSIEMAVLPPDENDSVPFPWGGGSGSLVADPLGHFFALLTYGSSSSDITFGTPLEWIWTLIKDKYPGADLNFDDLKAFLADSGASA